MFLFIKADRLDTNSVDPDPLPHSYAERAMSPAVGASTFELKCDCFAHVRERLLEPAAPGGRR